jgi:hypothetical protein
VAPWLVGALTPAGRYFGRAPVAALPRFRMERSCIAESAREVNDRILDMIDLRIEQCRARSEMTL